WGRRLPERRSHPDGARQAASAPVAKSNVAGPERRAAPGRPRLFFACPPWGHPQALALPPPRRRVSLLPKFSLLKAPPPPPVPPVGGGRGTSPRPAIAR